MRCAPTGVTDTDFYSERPRPDLRFLRLSLSSGTCPASTYPGAAFHHLGEDHHQQHRHAHHDHHRVHQHPADLEALALLEEGGLRLQHLERQRERQRLAVVRERRAPLPRALHVEAHRRPHVERVLHLEQVAARRDGVEDERAVDPRDRAVRVGRAAVEHEAHRVQRVVGADQAAVDVGQLGDLVAEGLKQAEQQQQQRPARHRRGRRQVR